MADLYDPGDEKVPGWATGTNSQMSASGEEEQLSSDSIPNVTNETGFLEAALWWAGKGFPVLPLAPGDNRPHPMLGRFQSFEKVATTNPHLICKWWTERKGANIGVATGRVSGVIVLDCDVKKGKNGLRELALWEELEEIEIPQAVTTRTPSGGLHLWFRLPKDCGPIPSPPGWLPGLDIRADGAQVAVPPSMRRWQYKEFDPQYLPYERGQGSVLSLPVVPDGVLADIRRYGGRYAERGSSGSSRSDLPSDEEALANGLEAGTRNTYIHDLACRWFRRYPESQVWEMAFGVWAATNQRDFTWQEVETSVNSAGRFIRREIREGR